MRDGFGKVLESGLYSDSIFTLKVCLKIYQRGADVRVVS